MIVYHVFSDYNVFQAYVHKCKYYPQEKAVLLIGPPREILLPRLVQGDNRILSSNYMNGCKELFDTVIKCDNPPEYSDEITNFDEKINKYYSEKFEEFGLDDTEIRAFSFCSFDS